MYTTKEDTIILPRLLVDEVMSQVAGFEYVTDERKGYYLCMAIKSIYQHELIKELLKNKYKDKYKDVIKRFNQYFSLMAKIKNYKDQIDDAPNIRDNIYHPYQRELNKLIEKVPLMYTTIYDIFVLLATKTNIGAYTPNKQQTRQFELQYKKVHYDLTRKQLGFEAPNPKGSPNSPDILY